ncbi:MAG: single-stranded-DNA-specific exonuclease RecJ [Vicingaceae bacterium]
MVVQNKRWTYQPVEDNSVIDALSESLNNLDKSLCEILVKRGISNYEEAKKFFRPSLDDLHPPFLMKNLEAGAKRLLKAIDNNEKILIYGDYDVDGTTSVALVYSFLSKHTQNIDFYIPDRYTEGYGISYEGINYAKANGFSLIIALDCGIKAVEKINYANENNIDFIICDHHTPGEQIPDCIVLDPKQNDCNYPYKELSGCGVGFKLLQGFCLLKSIPFDELYEFLDLLAVSISADIVPLTGENRVLTYYGIQKINKSPRPGIKALLEKAGIKKVLTVSDLVFTIAPRINASGRLETGKKAVELLIANDITTAEEKAAEIHQLNIDRKDVDTKITQEALEMIAANPKASELKSTVLFKEDWHKGVVGIVASRVIETYYKPTIILTESNGKATGSARSVSGYNVYDAIDQCAHLLEQFGGHKYAAGLTLSLENIEAFIEKFEEVVSATIPDELLIPEIKIDAVLSIQQIVAKGFYKVLKQFAPFGPQNMNPVFKSENLQLKEPPRLLGETKDHLKLKVFQPENEHIVLDAIGFNLGMFADELDLGVPFSMVYTIDENEWNGVKSLQLKIKDIKV